ncbi:MAG: hypothetical protein H7A31_00220 [Thermotogae bacterium]|nr:hypothetical protein [Thermotogota bacterium]MCP5465102.1 hypothetical protein [Thermotogota bacterium]HOO74495.1 hypothetical protein [Tepiditoga sp.]
MAKFITDKLDLNSLDVKAVQDLRIEKINIEELKHGVNEGVESYVKCSEIAKNLSEKLEKEINANDNSFMMNRDDTLYVVSENNYFRVKIIY